jgi:hypothetical protein
MGALSLWPFGLENEFDWSVKFMEHQNPDRGSGDSTCCLCTLENNFRPAH